MWFRAFDDATHPAAIVLTTSIERALALSGCSQAEAIRQATWIAFAPLYPDAVIISDDAGPSLKLRDGLLYCVLELRLGDDASLVYRGFSRRDAEESYNRRPAAFLGVYTGDFDADGRVHMGGHCRQVYARRKGLTGIGAT